MSGPISGTKKTRESGTATIIGGAAITTGGGPKFMFMPTPTLTDAKALPEIPTVIAGSKNSASKKICFRAGFISSSPCFFIGTFASQAFIETVRLVAALPHNP
jgi:hypothetical protein